MEEKPYHKAQQRVTLGRKDVTKTFPLNMSDRMVISKATMVLLVQTLSDNFSSLFPKFCCDGAELRASRWARRLAGKNSSTLLQTP